MEYTYDGGSPNKLRKTEDSGCRMVKHVKKCYGTEFNDKENKISTRKDVCYSLRGFFLSAKKTVSSNSTYLK